MCATPFLSCLCLLALSNPAEADKDAGLDWCSEQNDAIFYRLLLEDKVVVSEIAILPDQQDRVAKAIAGVKEAKARLRKKIGEQWPTTPAGRSNDPNALKEVAMSHRRRTNELREGYGPLDRRLRNELQDILLPFQIRRLSELRLQIAGVQVFSRPGVRNALVLSKEQTAMIDQALKEHQVWHGSFGGFVTGSPGVPLNLPQYPEAGELRKKEEQVARKIVSSLDPRQKDALIKLLGKPLAITAPSRHSILPALGVEENK